MASPSSILWQNDGKTVVLLDLPRSIEEAQVPSSALRAGDGRERREGSGGRDERAPTQLRRLVSELPPAAPFPTPEPKAGGSHLSAASPSAQLTELMTQAAVAAALDQIKQSHDGPWCLPRITSSPTPKPGAVKPPPLPPTPGPITDASPESEPSSPPPPPEAPPGNPPATVPDHDPSLYHLPPNSHPLPATISPTCPPSLPPTAPAQFNLIVLDPPWPNRSAKRKRTGPGSYTPAPDLSSIRALLHNIPVASRLAPGALVAVWVTNAARFADLLTRPHAGGVFARWDVELVGEWTWLKVTAAGEPVVALESRWRKPWERLLIARKRGAAGGGPVEGKVIVSVPDVHSRKPNLRGLFEGLLPERHEALEVFARNLTAGWWAWGDEVLLFQRKECWVDQSEEDERGA
ncbi:MT-A70-domain-containing protein [Staphylotrichum tortipilum]|uniref:MT-A70-domain-containing protein n=1 Tax=Staphylotrichum tortipilum TaxID=2831512 RepID=A0AAN6RTN9_9PEZI|nr:MT-A70-domain-containing protein [Staphylotrichum longicolle]